MTVGEGFSVEADGAKCVWACQPATTTAAISAPMKASVNTVPSIVPEGLLFQ
ncbi:MAG: hypothetical protein M3495_14635 [Pseudomonadota bacterium]|nr:hypothetical protein [Pseudomonadota bacterium]